MWKDTMLIVNTDHGFLLGEKDWWGKMIQPLYNEVANIPFFIWEPRSKKKNERRKSLVQTIDIAPTILEFFDIEKSNSMQGKILKDVIDSDASVRESALFGNFGCHVNVTDGKFVYMRAPVNPTNRPLNEYTLMPTHTWNLFSVRELQDIELKEPFSFSKGCKTMKIPVNISYNFSYIYGSLLFDLGNDPAQESPITDSKIEKRMIKLLIKLMKENDAPLEQFERLGLPKRGNGEIKDEHLALNENRDETKDKIGNTGVMWRKKGKSMYYGILNRTWEPLKRQVVIGIEKEINKQNLKELDEYLIVDLFEKIFPK